jgi:hypothetical protein
VRAIMPSTPTFPDFGDDPFLALPDKVLLQTHVDFDVGRKFDALARSNGHKRASYLRHLVELHVKALTPKLLRALQRAQPHKQKKQKKQGTQEKQGKQVRK